MLIREVPRAELSARLCGDGVHLDTGAFCVRLRIEWPLLADEFATMYAPYRMQDPPGIDDACIEIVRAPGMRRVFDRRAWVRTDGGPMIEPVPVERAFTALESALNWTLAYNGVAPLVMHAAALERNGRAVLMPAPSGSGKSTLTAAMSWRGWRLFTDEMSVFRFEDLALVPNPRPVSLKNEAIDVLRRYEPRAVLSPVYRGTHKGDVAYMRAPDDAVARSGLTAPVGWVVVPTWRAGARAELRPMPRREAFRWLVDSTVNYASTLHHGFDLLSGIVEHCRLYSLTYSDLDEAIALLDRLARNEQVTDAP